jgi:hypothetical protein
MAGRGYNPRQIQRQQANAIRRQDSSPTTGNSSGQHVEYNESTVSPVPSEQRSLDKVIDFCGKYLGWIAFMVTIASAMGTFLNFQSDLKRAEEDIKDVKQIADKNSGKLTNLDKAYAEINKDVNYMQEDISSIVTEIEKSNDKLEEITIKQVKIEYKSDKAKKIKRKGEG